MTVKPENRFTGNRCGGEVYQPMQNTRVHSRAAGPDEWLMLVIGGDPSTPQTHLCGGCAKLFTEFLAGGAGRCRRKRTGAIAFTAGCKSFALFHLKADVLCSR